MITYQHLHHAGNFADVVKHVLLTTFVTDFRLSDASLFCYDSHAGCGLYDLDQQLSGESLNGIARIWETRDAPAALAGFLALIRNLNKGKLRYYPGSAWLLHHLLRHDDRLYLNDASRLCHMALQRRFHGDERVVVFRQDAFEWLAALPSPPAVRRLIFIDPPFKENSEYQQLVTTLPAIARRRQDTIIIWYPLPEGDEWSEILTGLARNEANRVLRCEWQSGRTQGLPGCGMLFVDPPEGFEQRCRKQLLWLAERMGDRAKTRVTVELTR